MRECFLGRKIRRGIEREINRDSYRSLVSANPQKFSLRKFRVAGELVLTGRKRMQHVKE